MTSSSSITTKVTNSKFFPTKALAFFNEAYGNSWINFLIQPFAWDVLNVGSPFIMIFVSGQLRSHVFDFSILRSQSVVTVQTATVTMNTSNH
ncbi:hypothetical protein L3Y34_000571 [Caenorhabditis briggsae]|uniref:Serpentine receptor class gamma n=1 Tax=Caenorhabditis briggsae TaxID=6238 RepID=A0AAE9D9X9_CAEBR|nr:hypothetical protein L3Y34_000571 [Caenorhabditis briggsae]